MNPAGHSRPPGFRREARLEGQSEHGLAFDERVHPVCQRLQRRIRRQDFDKQGSRLPLGQDVEFSTNSRARLSSLPFAHFFDIRPIVSQSSDEATRDITSCATVEETLSARAASTPSAPGHPW